MLELWRHFIFILLGHRVSVTIYLFYRGKLVFVHVTIATLFIHFFRKLSRNMGNYQECHHLYKTIQVLEIYFNDFLAAGITMGLTSISPIMQIIGQYVCLEFWDKIPMPGFLFWLSTGFVNLIRQIVTQRTQMLQRGLANKLASMEIAFPMIIRHRFNARIIFCHLLIPCEMLE